MVEARGYEHSVAVVVSISGELDLLSFPIHSPFSMNPAGLQTVLQHVNGTSESFISAYYTAWDKDRPTLSSLYTPNSRIVWNGNPISGLAAYEQFIAKMPATKHDVRLTACSFAMRSSLEWLTCWFTDTSLRLPSSSRSATNQASLLSRSLLTHLSNLLPLYLG